MIMNIIIMIPICNKFNWFAAINVNFGNLIDLWKSTKELSPCQKLKCSNPYIFAT